MDTDFGLEWRSSDSIRSIIVESWKSEPRPILNRALLPTPFVSKNKLEAIISDGEAFSESHRAQLVVGLKP